MSTTTETAQNDTTTQHVKREALNPLLTAFVVTASVLIILANGLLCVFLRKDRRLWFQRMNKVMFSLAIADLLVGIVLIPQAVHEFYISSKEFPESMCRVLNATTWLSVTTSIYTFTVISILRLIYHNHRAFYSNHFEAQVVKSEAKISWFGLAVLLPWLLGLMQAVPLTVPGWNDTNVDFITCSLPYKSPTWVWTSGVTVFILPTIVITVCYTLMRWKMYKDNLGITEDRKDTFFLFILTIVFFLCWWPTCIYLSVKWAADKDSRGLYWGILNSLFNPVLYLCFHGPLRAKVRALFNCC